MPPIVLSIIAKLPQSVIWCEKTYPQYKLEWFKTPLEFKDSKTKAFEVARIILSDEVLKNETRVINIRGIAFYGPTQSLVARIDEMVMLSTLTTIFSSDKRLSFI